MAGANSTGAGGTTIVVGGGQAGLAAAYCLSRLKQNVTVLDSHTHIGETWRRRWDSLRLFTPVKFNALPGMPFPGDDFTFPTKDEAADYLESYAATFGIPIHLGVTVTSVTRPNGEFVLSTGTSQLTAHSVIVATGAYQVPKTPSLASELHPSIVQLHSFAYKNSTQLPAGTILVVGAGNSGAEIAIELAHAGRTVWLAGREVGHIPANILGRLLGGRPYWTFLSRVLSVKTPIGRKVQRKAIHQGAPLIRLTGKDVAEAGVKRCPRVIGVADGRPRLEDGRVLFVEGVVWATGFRPDYSWIKLPIFDETGYPRHEQGVVPDAPGLFFVGLHFQTALSSALLGGVGRDASYIGERVRDTSGRRRSVA